ncbi:MAG TPA: SIMPL domain-containing protein [Candidatus Aphodousia gallistercoris]|nr:SIMPL domain-containing protein [Candidatus Aphodousia gallistercoris]
MRYQIIKTLMVGSLCAIAGICQANSMNGISLNDKGVTLTVAGSAQLSVPNDEAKLIWTASAQETTLKEATNKVIQNLNEKINKIKLLSSELELQTLDVSSFPVYSQTKGKEIPRIIAWRVSQNLEVKANDTSLVAKVIETVNGELQLSSLSFGVSHQAQSRYQQELINQAISNATQKAVWVAESLGCQASQVRLNEIRFPGTTSIRPEYALMRASANKVSSDQIPAPVIEAGSSDLSLTISAEVTIKN